jgi:hypothetical protein
VVLARIDYGCAVNRKQQGDIGVAMAIAHYTRLGQVVSVPMTDSARYDLVVDVDGALKRVQVKTTGYQRKGRYEVHTKTCGGNQTWTGVSRYITVDEVDLVFIYTLAGAMYEMPASLIAGRGSVGLGPVVSEYLLPDLSSPTS